jgi:hypothetical protein
MTRSGLDQGSQRSHLIVHDRVIPETLAKPDDDSRFHRLRD